MEFSFDVFIGRFPYFATMILFLIGLFGLFFKQNLIKKLIGMNIMQAAVILFFIVHSYKWGASVPIRTTELGNLATQYVNPIPHALMLTAIVVSVATTGVALSLIIKIYQKYQCLDETEIIETKEST